MQAKKQASTATDPDDAPELTDAFFRDAEYYAGGKFIRSGRGRPPSGNAKELVSIRLDQDVLRVLRANGPGWQTRVNGMLRAAMDLGDAP